MNDEFPEIEEYEEEDREMDEFEMAIQDCGKGWEDTYCSLSGTEFCSFRCPFSQGERSITPP